jgi:hypothetical protein
MTYSDGAEHAIFEPLDFIAKLAGLVPNHASEPDQILRRFYPNRKHRVDVTPAKCDKGST